ncbi:ABC-2 type transport system ATP-binding protein [Agromyces terreus]|uniref:ABC-2 type transport system ATP-binding protein n=1 Tax=Agromyces terreus TaxID=424795 RepID=A0A9X2GZD0_9MICO|nr:ABC transporter ATP-binding protein [Agromyces terreus]MCP2370266.1 ABC-2 type transport system ATP-binding protein [Agromyces terreus]
MKAVRRAVLEARAIAREFPGGAGVRGIDLTVAAGEIHAVVGLNGAGKTTLMRLLLGMLRPQAGTVRLDGVEIADAAPQAWAGVGHLVEHPLAYPELDVRSNLLVSARLHGIPRERAEALVARALAEFDLERYARVRASRLSLGNRQRVGLAGALQHDPGLIVLDEPTNALDPAGVILLREALLRRAGAGAGVLVSSHHLDEVARIADRVTVVNAGRVIGNLDPAGVDLERAFFALVHADDVERPRA